MGLSPLIKHPQPQLKDETKLFFKALQERGWMEALGEDSNSPTVDLELPFKLRSELKAAEYPI